MGVNILKREEYPDNGLHLYGDGNGGGTVYIAVRDLYSQSGQRASLTFQAVGASVDISFTCQPVPKGSGINLEGSHMTWLNQLTVGTTSLVQDVSSAITAIKAVIPSGAELHIVTA